MGTLLVCPAAPELLGRLAALQSGYRITEIVQRVEDRKDPHHSRVDTNYRWRPAGPSLR
ncbi:MAG: hypothetical protein HY911_10530 [Desulfobacterales bacterium]|nr:hypothetical protein [Desulfobacterales bacterium]